MGIAGTTGSAGTAEVAGVEGVTEGAAGADGADGAEPGGAETGAALGAGGDVLASVAEGVKRWRT